MTKKIKKVEMATLEECSIRVFLKSDCHRKEYGHNKTSVTNKNYCYGEVA